MRVCVGGFCSGLVVDVFAFRRRKSGRRGVEFILPSSSRSVAPKSKIGAGFNSQGGARWLALGLSSEGGKEERKEDCLLSPIRPVEFFRLG